MKQLFDIKSYANSTARRVSSTKLVVEKLGYTITFELEVGEDFKVHISVYCEDKSQTPPVGAIIWGNPIGDDAISKDIKKFWGYLQSKAVKDTAAKVDKLREEFRAIMD